MLNLLEIRRRLGRDKWSAPEEFFMEGQWCFTSKKIRGSSIIVSIAAFDTLGDGLVEWVHASISHNNQLPSYEDLKMLHAAVYVDGWAYQVFAPPARHINIHANALHLFGRLDGKHQLPDIQMQTGLNMV